MTSNAVTLSPYKVTTAHEDLLLPNKDDATIATPPTGYTRLSAISQLPDSLLGEPQLAYKIQDGTFRYVADMDSKAGTDGYLGDGTNEPSDYTLTYQYMRNGRLAKITWQADMNNKGSVSSTGDILMAFPGTAPPLVTTATDLLPFPQAHTNTLFGVGMAECSSVGPISGAANLIFFHIPTTGFGVPVLMDWGHTDTTWVANGSVTYITDVS